MEIEPTPLGILLGVIGIVVGYICVKSMSGMGIGEVSYHVPIFWQILTPVATGAVCFLIGNNMSS